MIEHVSTASISPKINACILVIVDALTAAELTNLETWLRLLKGQGQPVALCVPDAQVSHYRGHGGPVLAYGSHPLAPVRIARHLLAEHGLELIHLWGHGDFQARLLPHLNRDACAVTVQLLDAPRHLFASYPDLAASWSHATGLLCSDQQQRAELRQLVGTSAPVLPLPPPSSSLRTLPAHQQRVPWLLTQVTTEGLEAVTNLVAALSTFRDRRPYLLHLVGEAEAIHTLHYQAPLLKEL